ncbi:protein BatD [Shewanella avicenniae]|uniref:Protein BatD n=2 Tax=Shewanella avicenniae TaxID=2814294 RepID=A0ABX7QVM3_9GAMM|nr:protein BatD [Shewanella avicenniae]
MAVILLLPLNAFALSQLQASVDRNPVMENEYLALTVSADDELASNALDTSALLKDFVVGRTSVSRSTQIVNFDTHKETNWQILLKPKHQGVVTIPALVINGVSSQPIAIQVIDGSSQPQQAKNLFLTASVSDKDAYVGQMLTYRVKLYLAVDLQRGVLSAPNTGGAQVKQVGDDKDGSEIINGRRYRVIERTYSIVADTPGQLVIAGPSFNGDVLVDTPSRSMFSFQESRPVEAQGDSVMVNINPKPDSYHGDWLVADLVNLSEDWQDNQSFEVGQPITRNITLLASNADDTSLPDIKLPLPASMKSYPEKPKRNTMARDGRTIAQLSQTVAIVPSQAGDFTLPEIKVAWWNPHLKQQQFATLPARKIQVKPAANTPAPQIDAPQTQTSNDSGIWPWTTALFALLWLVTLYLWWQARQQSAKPLEQTAASKTAHQPSSVDAAIAAQNAGEVLNALLREVSTLFKRPITLKELAEVAPELAQTASDIQAAQYGPNPTDSNALYQHLKSQLASLKGQKTQPRTNKALQSLNP